jgi:toxin HigB-1
LILSFADEETADIYPGKNSKKARKRLPSILFSKAQTKLDMLNRAFHLEDLRVPPNNRLEKLEGNLNGKYSIRINDPYRIIFAWNAERGGASLVLDVPLFWSLISSSSKKVEHRVVQIIDYH